MRQQHWTYYKISLFFSRRIGRGTRGREGGGEENDVVLAVKIHEICSDELRSSYEKGVCLSVCPSGKSVHCDKTEERSVHTFLPYEKTLSLVL